MAPIKPEVNCVYRSVTVNLHDGVCTSLKVTDSAGENEISNEPTDQFRGTESLVRRWIVGEFSKNSQHSDISLPRSQKLASFPYT
jgi:hypothetical protein